MAGTDLDLFRRLRAKTSKTLIAAGGIASIEEVRELLSNNIEVALGMSVYTGRIPIRDLEALLP
jgi:phosphoribosylformimino-5-aminoimidazole carboxamide ribonucleotide (ProFAR) isomerase